MKKIKPSQVDPKRLLLGKEKLRELQPDQLTLADGGSCRPCAKSYLA